MKKIGFIGAYDKTDLILSISKVLVKAGKKVLLIDSTILQKAKYIATNILPTVNYITSYEEIDVAIGFKNIKQVKQYIGLEENEKLEYDVIFIDTDNLEGAMNFEVSTSDKIYYVTSFDGYSLKKGLEAIGKMQNKILMTKVLFSSDMLKEE